VPLKENAKNRRILAREQTTPKKNMLGQGKMMKEELHVVILYVALLKFLINE